MKIFYNRINETNRNHFEVQTKAIKIGRRSDCDIVLASDQIAEIALVVRKQPDGWYLETRGLTSCQVGDEMMLGGRRRKIAENVSISLFPFRLDLVLPDEETVSEDDQRRELDDRMNNLLERVHRKILEHLDHKSGPDSIKKSEERMLAFEKQLDEISRQQGITHASQSDLALHIAANAVRSRILENLLRTSQSRSQLVSRDSWTHLVTEMEERERDLDKLSSQVCSLIPVQMPDPTDTDDDIDIAAEISKLELRFWKAWDSLTANLMPKNVTYLANRYIKKQIKDVVFGNGPLEDLLRIPSITEIMVVDYNHIYIEKSGVLGNSGRTFFSNDVTQTIIERIVSRVGRRIDKSQPLVDARLEDGSRVNAVVPPLAVSGPSLTIRRFPDERLTIPKLIEKGTLDQTVSDFLNAAVFAKKNIVVSGGTGTGKTTLLNCLSNFIPANERIVTIEDTAELQLGAEHVVRLETKQANIEGTGEYTIRDLVKNALRMRPDRVVIGECRGAEALDMLQAMNTGHDGSLTTIHANNARDVILRLEVLVRMAAELPIESIHRQIASAIDLVVQLHRLRGGPRVVSQITEIVGYDEQTKELRTKDIFSLTGSENERSLAPTGRLPTFMPALIASGKIELDSFYVGKGA